MASTRGRQVVVPLTNKSGGGVVAGDVVIVDTSNDAAFTTTTSARSETSIGVAQETIANNGTGRVLLSGYAALVNVPASVTRGHYVETHTVAKQATGNSTRRSGSFGQFLTGGTTPTAMLWGSTDQTATGSTTDLAFTRHQRTAGTYSTTSTTFADVDGTNLSRSLTTTGNLVLIIVSGSYESDVANDTCGFDISIDGSREGGTFGLVMASAHTANRATNMSFTYTKSGLSAASHTFSLQWRRAAGTGTQSLHGNSSTVPLTFTVLELYVS